MNETEGQNEKLLKLFNKLYDNVEGCSGPHSKDREWRHDCKFHGHLLLMKAFEGFEGINWNEVIVWGQRCYHNGVYIGMDLRYSSLYAYVISKGIVVPYSEWIWETSFLVKEYEFKYDMDKQKGLVFKNGVPWERVG